MLMHLLPNLQRTQCWQQQPPAEQPILAEAEGLMQLASCAAQSPPATAMLFTCIASAARLTTATARHRLQCGLT